MQAAKLPSWPHAFADGSLWNAPGVAGSGLGAVAVLQTCHVDVALAIHRDHAADAADGREDLRSRRIELQHEGSGTTDHRRGRRGKPAGRRVGSGLARDNRVARQIHQNAVETRSGSEARSHTGGAADERGVDDLAIRVQLGNEALKLALRRRLQSAGRDGKIGRVGVAENRGGARGIDGDCPCEAEATACERSGIQRLSGGAEFGNERVGLIEISLEAGNIQVARGIGLNRIDHAVGKVGERGGEQRPARAINEKTKTSSDGFTGFPEAKQGRFRPPPRCPRYQPETHQNKRFVVKQT